MPRRPLPQPLDTTPFSVAEAFALGTTQRRLRASDLHRPFWGARSHSPPVTVLERAEAFLPLLGLGEVFSHETAAALWGLPLPVRSRGAPLHVTGPGERRPRRPGVIGHRSKTVTGRFVHALPVVDPIDAWLQCASLLERDDLVAMGDALAGRWSPHDIAREIPVERLAAAVQAWGSRRGAVSLRRAFEWVRPRVWSPQETQLRLVIVRGGLPEPPWLNHEVKDARGGVIGTPDMAYPELRIAIEYEGDGHRTDRRQWRRDLARYERFADAGWRVVRVTADDLADPCILLARLEALLSRECQGAL